VEKILRVALLEPYYGGSHATFVDCLRLHSRHHITAMTLPARKWKWRMRGAALWLAQEVKEWLQKGDGRGGDVIICSEMLSVADLRALLPARLRNIPIICYFHENQLTYPIPAESERDYQYGMTNITSSLAADAVWFNSRFHLEDFLSAAHNLLRRMPDFVPPGVSHAIRKKATVLPPPVWMGRMDRKGGHRTPPFTILWCHRWEYDKNPEPFFSALLKLDREGYDFDLVLLGEQFRTAPTVFDQSWDSLQSHIRHAGYLPDHSQYLSMLSRCDLVVSTAIQENFGISVVEAILAGCQPLLPDRLVYPEIIPPEFHSACLYPSDAALLEHLRHLLDSHGWLSATAQSALQNSVEARFTGEAAVARIDDAIVDVVDAHPAIEMGY